MVYGVRGASWVPGSVNVLCVNIEQLRLLAGTGGDAFLLLRAKPMDTDFVTGPTFQA